MYIDPQEKIWWHESAHRYMLQKMQRGKYRDSLMPLDGIAGFSAYAGESNYQSTLFRFPLRTESTYGLISKTPSDISEVLPLMQAFKDEAELLLLFLRSVETIEVYTIDRAGNQSLQYCATIAGVACDLNEKRRSFKTKLEKSFKHRKCYGLGKATPETFTAKCRVKFTGNHGCRESAWLVSNRVGSGGNLEIIEAANKVCAFPWVGTALNLSTPIKCGRVFCVIPLPEETKTELPVHINGTFSLNDDRRSLKWPGKESGRETAANWNKLLVEKVLPPCYASLLQEALHHDIAAQDFYRSIPDIERVSQSMWEGLLLPLCSEVFEKACLWSLDKRWIRAELEEAAVVVEGLKFEAGDVVQQVLGACGYSIVLLPSNMWQALDLASKSHTVKKVTPQLTRNALRGHRMAYEKKSNAEKLELLQYCFLDSGGDSDGSEDKFEEEPLYDLNSLYLLPLANGAFTKFKSGTYSMSSVIYVCSKKYPRKLLPNAEQFLLCCLDDSTLQASLECLASSEQTQLRMLDAEGVAKLLPSVFPEEWEHQVEVSVNATGNFPLGWFEMFWKWVEDHRLELFVNKLVLPIVHKTRGLTSIVKLQLKSPIVHVSKGAFLSTKVARVLSKLGIKYTECEFLKHDELMCYLNDFSPNGVLTAIKIKAGAYSLQSIQKVTFTSEEAVSFQKFLVSRELNSEHIEVLENLPIFLPAGGSSSPLSLAALYQHVKTVIVEPYNYQSLGNTLLPPFLVVLCKDKNQRSLLEMFLPVKFPESVSSLLRKYIFPQIRCGSITISCLVPIMQKVLANLSHSIAAEYLADLRFIPHVPHRSKNLASPNMLYDPSKSELRDLFRGESVFPLDPFNKELYLRPLRECGLRLSVTSQNLYEVLYEVARSRQPECSRIKAVFNYIKEHSLLSDAVRVDRRSLLLKEAICELAKRNSILPIESSPPVNDYPKCLPWKGSGFDHRLTKMDDSVQLCTDRDLVLYSTLVGSQMYIVQCSSELRSTFGPVCPFKNVLRQLAEIIDHKKDFTSDDLDSVTTKFYKYLERNLSSLIKASRYSLTIDLHSSEWIWNAQEEKFVRPADVAFKRHPKFSNNLSPYIYIFPSKFKDLFLRFGAHEEVTDKVLVSVLERVKDRQLTGYRPWEVVTDVLKWLTDDGKVLASAKVVNLSSVYVPVESSSRFPEMVQVEDVTYVEGRDQQHYLHVHKHQNLQIIHKRYGRFAKYLGAVPLTKRLNISADLTGDAGQSEPLLQRIQNILHDYEGGLTIVKELIQNADDAGASEVNVCYDARKHVIDDEYNLRFPGMSRSHGPALLVQNNKPFSDEDFKNIQNLAGATKRDEPLKIGKFGVGFCSVYHITDIPSFVSREWLYIFDPTLDYLKDEIDNPHLTGKYLNFTEELVQPSPQMAPYKKLFGFQADRSYNGTIFRLPFRSQKHGVSPVKFGEKDIAQLREDIKKAGPKLLLFLENVNCITFSWIAAGCTSPQTQLQVKKCAMPHESGDDHGGLSACKVKVSVTDFLVRSTPTKELWLVAGSRDNTRVGAVACLLEEQSPKPVVGEAFCFLPLHDNLETGLPVHVNANFAIMNDRKGIHRSDTTSGSEQSQFNVALMKTNIPQAYHKLLSVLQELCEDGKVAVDDYVFHSLWPVQGSLQTHNPWDHFIPELYQLISSDKLCYSETVKEWKHLTDCKFLPANILQDAHRDDIVEVATALQYPLIELPVEHCNHLKERSCLNLISESQFLEDFFANIDSFPMTTRNNILLSLITTYAKEIESTPCIEQYSPFVHEESRCTVLLKFIEDNCCIPCSPEGEELKSCCEIVDHRAEFASLYEEWEGMFVVNTFRTASVLEALKELGMFSDKLPWSMMIERAETVNTLYQKDREKALRRTQLLLRSIDKIQAGMSLPAEAEELYAIPFLPILQKPHDYPQELYWKGRCKDLLSCSDVLVDPYSSSSLHLVAGSTACIVSTETPSVGGCGNISHELALSLKISLSPPINDVLSHLKNIVDTRRGYSEDFDSWVNRACAEIYKCIEAYLGTSVADRHTISNSFCSPPGLLWTGSEFINPDSVALDWHHNGPHLYCRPPLLKLYSGLQNVLELRKKFETDQIVEALITLKEYYGEMSLPHQLKDMVVATVKALAESLDDDCMSDAESLDDDLTVPDAESLDYDYMSDAESLDDDHTMPDPESLDDDRTMLDKLFLPDTNLCMRHVKDLAWNDAPWCTTPDKEVLFLCDDIPGPTALKLGVKPLRQIALDKYGDPYGQYEPLTQRIRNILRSYTHNETVLKELLQNADDAKASRLYFILDERTHGTEKLPSDNWKELQGPALLVWNDKGFTEENFTGISNLGLGSKRSKEESIGQFGIGFNVVYHLTDCPSFFTNGNTLCALDPHCRYVPGATQRNPGMRWKNLDTKFWNNWCDLKSTYLREKIKCPDEMSSNGTLFRFPLRCTEKSGMVEEDYVPCTSSKMKEDLNEWAPKMKETLLFLKHVSELRFFVISEGATEMTTTHHFKANLTKDDLQTFQDRCRDFSGDCTEAFLVSYCLELIEKAPMNQKEEWFVQQGIGDVSNHEQQWKFLSYIKPTHGIAAKIKDRSDFTPKIFCFLPLAQDSKLPVHVNGNFILDSSSRSDLWKSRDSRGPDNSAQWNDRLIEALGSSYANFLVNCQRYVVQESYAKKEDSSRQIDWYYDLFPRWTNVSYPPEGNMLNLAKHTYKILGKEKSKVLATVVKDRSSGTSRFDVHWQPVSSDDSSKQIHFWPQTVSSSLTAKPEVDCAMDRGPEMTSVEGCCPTDDSLAHYISAPPVSKEKTATSEKLVPPILKRLGMLLTVAPWWIHEHFNSIKITIPEATPTSVFQYYSIHFPKVFQAIPCKIADSVFKDVDSFKTFVKFVSDTFDVLVTDGENNFISKKLKFVVSNPPLGLPLLLTADETLRGWAGKNEVILSKFCEIFPSKHSKFLHPQLLELHPEYFLEASEDNWELVHDILDSTLADELICQRLKYASAYINVDKELKPLWKCICEDPVIKKHLKEIVQKWALILSDKNELFRYDPKHTYLMPVAPPRKPKHITRSITTASSPDEEKEEQEYKFLTNIFEVFKANKMPCVHSLVRKVSSFCPIFSKPEGILTNLHHLYRSFDTLCMQSKIYDNIPDLFSYFSRINFMQDETRLDKIKSLPLFRSVDGKYHTLPGKVYFWPEHICKEGINKLLHDEVCSVVFLDREDGHWHKLYESLGLQEIEPMTLYADYLFPNFHLLSEKERLCQLQHIRDTPELFQTAADCIKEGTDSTTLHTVERKFIQGLENLPMIVKHGKLACVCEFYDPCNSFFKFFPGSYDTLPKEFVTKEWLSFFAKIGIQKQPTQIEYEQFCDMVSKGDHSDIAGASKALLKCLFKVYEWHSDEKFLHRIRTIPFVSVKTLEDHHCILPASNTGVHVVYQEDGTEVHLTYLQNSACKHASVIWTVRPFVNLPDITFPPMGIFLCAQDARNAYETRLMQQLGVLAKPSASHVVENIVNLSQSRFSDFKLFEIYAEKKHKCDLVSVLAENFSYLDRLLTNEASMVGKKSHPSHIDVSSQLTPLQNVPCIPVSSDCTNVTSKPVLVKPLQVVCSITNELRTSLHPFLCRLPSVISNSIVLGHIGVNPHPQLNNILHALELINFQVKMPLDHNAGESVRSLLKLLYQLLSLNKSGLNDTTTTLHLPSRDHRLFKSTNLIYNDLDPMSYGGFNPSSIPNSYSVVSLLCNEYSELEEYGFRLSDLLSKLPDHLHPKHLSKCCGQKLHSSCQIQEYLSPFALGLKEVLKEKTFMEVVEHVLRTKNQSSRFTSSLQVLVDLVEVVTVSNLKVDILFEGTSSIGTAEVEFLLQRSERKHTLFVHAQPLLFNIYERVVKCLTNEVLSMCNIPRASMALDEVEKVMGVILSGGTIDNIRKVLVMMSINPANVKLERDFDYSSAYPIIGGDIPEELHHRLRFDINNQFKPQELVGFEKESGCLVYAVVECRNKDGSNLDQYVILIGEDVQIVSVMKLYKILCIKGDKEYELYDPTPGAVEHWDAIQDIKLDGIERMIHQELQQISTLKDDTEKHKSLEAILLKWHPGKTNHPYAAEAFQFLQKQLEDMQAVDMKHLNDMVHRKQTAMEKEMRKRHHQGIPISDPLMNCQVTVSKNLAKVWIAQAKYDMRALEVIYVEAENPGEKLCAHVCFQAHQVVEKTLKAGMYATVGLRDYALHKHFLVSLAEALQTEIPHSTLVLPELAGYFEQTDCYLSSRYPNRCGGRIPSECFSLQKAEKAFEKSKQVFEIVHSYISDILNL